MLRSYNPAKLSLQALPALIDWPELYWWVGRRFDWPELYWWVGRRSRAVATADPPDDRRN